MKQFAVVMLLTGLAGCASNYQLPSGRPAASLALASQTDSVKTTMVVTYGLAHADEACNQNSFGTKLGGDTTHHGGGQADAARIEAGRAFTFTANYVETRFGESRACAITATFQPVQDHRYLARIASTNQVSECKIGVFDVTHGSEEPVAFHLPATACNGKPNGLPLRETAPPITIYVPASR